MIGIKDQYFGTEIEMTGITRQRAAEVVAEMFGTEAYYDGTTYGIWSVIDSEGKKWKFMSDGSIYTQRKVYGRIVDASGNYDTYGLFRATHSHIYAPLRSVLNMCHWHIAPYPLFAYRGIIIPLLCSYRGGS